MDTIGSSSDIGVSYWPESGIISKKGRIQVLVAGRWGVLAAPSFPYHTHATPPLSAPADPPKRRPEVLVRTGMPSRHGNNASAAFSPHV